MQLANARPPLYLWPDWRCWSIKHVATKSYCLSAASPASTAAATYFLYLYRLLLFAVVVVVVVVFPSVLFTICGTAAAAALDCTGRTFLFVSPLYVRHSCCYGCRWTQAALGSTFILLVLLMLV